MERILSISFNSTRFYQLACQLLLILLLLICSNSNLMGLINYFLLVDIFWLWALNLQSRTKILEAGKFLFSFWSFLKKNPEKLIELLMGITNYFFKFWPIRIWYVFKYFIFVFTRQTSLYVTLCLWNYFFLFFLYINCI